MIVKAVGRGTMDWVDNEVRVAVDRLVRYHQLKRLATELGAELDNPEERQVCEDLLDEVLAKK